MVVNRTESILMIKTVYLTEYQVSGTSQKLIFKIDYHKSPKYS